LGVRNPTPKLQSLLTQERLNLRTANLADTFKGSTEHELMKHFGENGAWAYPGTAQIFEYPLLSQERVKLRTSSLAGVFRASMGT